MPPLSLRARVPGPQGEATTVRGQQLSQVAANGQATLAYTAAVGADSVATSLTGAVRQAPPLGPRGGRAHPKILFSQTAFNVLSICQGYL